MFSRGEILGARFRLIDKIGEGGMGVVWLARDERLACDVALKVLHGALLHDEHSAARLRNEARAAAKVAHPSICRVLDVGEHEQTPYLVMELLRGASLAAVLERDKRLPAEQAVSIAESVLEALAAAHAEAVLHRDMKPENVFLCDDGTVKVLDFGVAKILDDDERVRLTRTGALIGTPAYMAPELARGHASDERADLWSVGTMLFEMLSGTLPFAAQNYQGMLVAIATGAAPSLRERCPSLDAELVAIVDRSLAPAVDDRWQSARAFADALARWREARGVSRSTPAPTASAGRRTPRRSPREQAILTLTDPHARASIGRGRALLVLTALLVLGALAWRWARSPARARSSPLPTLTEGDAAVRSADPRDGGAVHDARVVDPRTEDAPTDARVDAVVDAAANERSARLRARGDGGRDSGARQDERAASRPGRGRRSDGGASAGIVRDPDF